MRAQKKQDAAAAELQDVLLGSSSSSAMITLPAPVAEAAAESEGSAAAVETSKSSGWFGWLTGSDSRGAEPAAAADSAPPELKGLRTNTV